MAVKMSASELAILKLIRDPVAWVEATLRNPEPGMSHLPIKLRPYQAAILRHPTKRKVCRMGRRCVAKGTPVLLASRQWKAIEDIRPGDKVLAWDEGQLVSAPVLFLYDNDVQGVFRITLENGWSVDCTSNHPLQVQSQGWVSIEDGLKTGDLATVLANDVFVTSPVATITWVDYQQTYDLEVDNVHNYICNGIVTKNTGKTSSMVMHIIWFAYTHRDSKQIIATPYQSQIDLIFDMIRQYVKAAPGLASSITRDIKNPSKIELSNGSIIRGFTAGTKSGDSGASLRGQAADWIYLDELDYLADSDVETISAIALDRPSIGIWGSSTPTGRRGMFWKMCTGQIRKKIRDESGQIISDESTWQEFYHPSTENPNWNEDMEMEFRGMFSEVAYEHEVMAEFGEETVGVFKKNLIDAARSEYTYDQARLAPKMGPRIMGVDWDKYANASQAVIMEYNQATRMFVVIHRHETPKSAFTLTNAVNRIIELNEEYRLDQIFVDRGYGEYQVETLHKYGQENPKSGLHYKVRGVAFSETRDIIDPYTKEIKSEPVKPFMVNQLTNILESHRLQISEYDEMIIRQMENYQVIKKTVGGAPVYTANDEHALDCMFLCCLGYVEKYPEIIDEVFITHYANTIAKIKTDEAKPKHIIDQMAEAIQAQLQAVAQPTGRTHLVKFNTRGKKALPGFKRSTF
jgi:hypothetical protein